VEELARESLYDKKRRVLERVVGAEDIEGGEDTCTSRRSLERAWDSGRF
jgi:hypothetical protein